MAKTQKSTDQLDYGPCINANSTNLHCTSEECQIFLRETFHWVSPNDFEVGVRRAHAGGLPTHGEVERDAAVLTSELDLHNCETEFVILDGATIGFRPYPYNQTDGFSIAYLRGVLRLTDISKIHFFRSLNEFAEPTLSLKVLYGINSIYFGNASEFNPFPPKKKKHPAKPKPSGPKPKPHA